MVPVLRQTSGERGWQILELLCSHKERRTSYPYLGMTAFGAKRTSQLAAHIRSAAHPFLSPHAHASIFFDPARGNKRARAMPPKVPAPIEQSAAATRPG